MSRRDRNCVTSLPIRGLGILLGAAGALIGLAGCSTRLSVQVDILDKRYWQSAQMYSTASGEGVAQLEAWIAAESSADRERVIASARQTYARVMDCVVDSSFMDRQTADEVTANDFEPAAAEVRAAWDDATAALASSVVRYRIAEARSKGLAPRDGAPDKTRADPEALRAELVLARAEVLERVRSFDRVGEAVRSELTGKYGLLVSTINKAQARGDANADAASACLDDLAAELERVYAPDLSPQVGAMSLPMRLARVSAAGPDAVVEGGVVETARGIVGDLRILEDENASFAINAPPAYWSGRYNNANGAGGPGNVDVAIIMDDAGSFSIKGLRHDTGAVTAATFQAIRQAVRVAAVAGGVPLSLPESPAQAGEGEQGEGASAGAGSGDRALNTLIRAERAASDHTNAARARRDAAEAMLRGMLGAANAAALDSADGANDDAREAAVHNARLVFEAHRQALTGAPDTQNR